jgi:hypothetical protein
MPTFPLSRRERAIASSLGIAEIRIKPARAYESWTVKRVAVENPGTSVSTVRVYRHGMGSFLIDASGSANRDLSDSVYTVANNETLSFEFSEATPGSECIVVIEGDAHFPDSGAYRTR